MSDERLLLDRFNYNITMRNTSNGDEQAKYSANLNQAFLSNAENFTVAVTRFKVPSFRIPMFHWKPGKYYVAIGSRVGTASVVVSEEVTYDTEYHGANVNDGVYYYDAFVESVNDALQAAFAAVLATAGHGSQVDWTDMPIVNYDPENKLFSILYPVKNVGGVNPSERCIWSIPTGVPNRELFLFFSSSLFELFNGFPTNEKLTGLNFTPPLPDITFRRLWVFEKVSERFAAADVTQNPNYTFAGVVAWVQKTANYPTLTSWHKLSRIVFLTTLPVIPENLGSTLPQFIGKPLAESILTDFNVIPADQALREYIFYATDGYVRRVNFDHVGTLQRMDVSIYYIDDDLVLHPVLIPPGAEANVKLEFERRPASQLLLHHHPVERPPADKSFINFSGPNVSN